MLFFKENKKIWLAILQAALTFFAFFSLLIVTVLFYDFSDTNFTALSFILALTCIVLIAKSVYEIAVGSYRTKQMAEEMANELVKSSQQLFIEVYRNSPVAYLIADTNGDVVSSNMAAARFLGLPTEKLVNSNLFNFVKDDVEHVSLLKQKFQKGIVISDEEVKINSDHNLNWAKLSFFQFSGTDGKRLSLITLIDITKQKEIEIAKSEFVSLASHQLRTPIAGMRWSAELLLLDGGETFTAQQKRYINRLLSSIQRMSTLVDDFLQVSRFELGTRVLKQESVLLQELFDEIVEEQVEAANGKRLTVKKDYDSAIKSINTDLSLLRMVVTNLYTNAIKYSRNGEEVYLSYRQVEGELVITVKDNGIGIPLAEQPRIFSKIFRASNAVKDVPDGTGLGLYIAEKAVATMRGKISFVSNEETGTIFTVIVPVA